MDSSNLHNCVNAAITAKSMIDKRITEGTRKTYRSKLNKLNSWICLHYPELFNPEEKSLILPLPETALTIEIFQNFFGSLAMWNDPAVYPEPRTDLPSKPISYTSLRLTKSAFVWLHLEQNLRVWNQLDTALENQLQGYQKQMGDWKLTSVVPAIEGKLPLSHTAYETIAKKFMSSTPFHRRTVTLTATNENPIQSKFYKSQSQPWNNSLFGHLFFVLQWNLMARSNTVAKILLSHISWSEDCLLVVVPKHKGDQEGKSVSKPKHVYSNPLSPHICPVLALAIYVFSNSFQLTFNNNRIRNSLFEGTEQEKRWQNTFNRLLSSLSESERAILGDNTNASDYCTHSCRKGSISYVSGLKDGPATHAIFLRAGWTLGAVQQRYIFEGQGGDQFAGRAVSCLPADHRFGVLPPMFKEGTISKLGIGQWEDILPGYSNFPSCFKSVIPYLLSSLVFHYESTWKDFDDQHPLKQTNLYTNGWIKLLQKDLLELQYGRSFDPPMQATGVPTNIAITTKLDEAAKAIMDHLKNVPTETSKEVIRRCKVKGAVPLTEAHFETLQQLLLSRVETLIIKNNNNNNTNKPNVPVLNNEEDPILFPENNFQLFKWSSDNSYHMVPHGYSIPRNNPLDIWKLWHYGNKEEKIQPLRRLTPNDLTTNEDKQQLTRTKKIMKDLEDIMIEMKLIDGTGTGAGNGNGNGNKRLYSFTQRQTANFFQMAYIEYMRRLKPDGNGNDNGNGNGRISYLGMATIYKIRSKRRRMENEIRDLIMNQDSVDNMIENGIVNEAPIIIPSTNICSSNLMIVGDGKEFKEQEEKEEKEEDSIGHQEEKELSRAIISMKDCTIGNDIIPVTIPSRSRGVKSKSNKSTLGEGKKRPLERRITGYLKKIRAGKEDRRNEEEQTNLSI